MSRQVRAAFSALCVWLCLASVSHAAPYAAMVMDARTGEVLHSRNADTRLHPASLTKMMTLYIAFEAIRMGEITLDTKVRISQNAASEQPSRLGLRSGQRIELRYLIRAAAVKSANDAATAIGEAIEGSEAAFARRMTRTAQALGMTRTTFKNAHGLTTSGHLSTARDMTVMGRRLFYDYPQYYNIFSRRSTNAGLRQVSNTNRRLLAAYRGADGIKTGYTNAAGFNLVASAQRGEERIIATVFGGRSGATRNARVAELLDMGFARAPSHATVRRPVLPVYGGSGSSRPQREIGAVTRSLRPAPRPVRQPDEGVLVALRNGVEDAVAEAIAETEAAELQDKINEVVNTAAALPEPEPEPEAAIDRGLDGDQEEPLETELAAGDPEPSAPIFTSAETTEATLQTALAQPEQPAEPVSMYHVTALEEPEPRIITRMSSSGPAEWAVRVPGFTSQYMAERALLKVAMKEMNTLETASRSVQRVEGSYQAVFSGLTADRALFACQRLSARNIPCNMVEPG